MARPRAKWFFGGVGMQTLDVLIIGSGPGGYRAAVLAALRGLRVALVERAQWGGCCLNRGCVPKKDWYHTARTLASQASWAGRGIVGAGRGALPVAWDHQHKVVQRVRTSYIDYLKRLGVRQYQGSARFRGPRRIEVEGVPEILEPAHVILATGSAPRVPPGFDGIPGVLTTDDLYTVPPPPGRRVAVVGGGVIASEFAFILSMLGQEVRWFARRPPLSDSRFSVPALGALKDAWARHGLAAEVVSLGPPRRVGTELLLAVDGAEVAFDWILLATGRAPCVDGLDPSVGGVASGAQGIELTQGLETTAPGVYAIGDCTGGRMTANQALYDAALVVDAIVRNGPCGARREERVPEVLYSALELARVGLDENAAEDEGLEPALGFAAFETSPRALGQDEPEGFVRLLADMDAGTLLGGEIVGAEAGELIHLLALQLGEPLNAIARGAYNHPSRAEEVLNAVETLAHKWGLGDAVFSAAASKI